MTRKILFGLAALIFVGTLLTWYFIAHSSQKVTVGPNEMQVGKISDTDYQVFMGKDKPGGWYDTGIWVKSGMIVHTGSVEGYPEQPYQLMIGRKVFDSILTNKNSFATAITVSDGKGFTPEALTQFENIPFDVVVPTQEKILIRVSDNATNRPEPVVVHIQLLR